MTKLIDLKNKKFGRLTVMERGENRKKNITMWWCLCDCGKLINVRSRSLITGNTKSCGCLKKEGNHFVHGFRTNGEFTREYHAWQSMKKRCLNPKNKSYKNYGGRGIKICERWLNSCQNFLDDMGPCPKKYTLERLNNNGDYTPENCIWASRYEQSRNNRRNRWIEFEGKTMILADWAREKKIRFLTLHNRLSRGWSIEKALTMPLKEREE